MNERPIDCCMQPHECKHQCSERKNYAEAEIERLRAEYCKLDVAYAEAKHELRRLKMFPTADDCPVCRKLARGSS